MLTVAITIVAIIASLFGAKTLLGFIIIEEDKVGIVIKKLGKPLPNGQFIALNGEAGYQADTLSPGWHFGYWFFMFDVVKQPITIIKEGEIGLINARDGKDIPSGRLLGEVVDSNSFQDARKFLQNGGQKGRQLGILTSGVHKINTALFEVITTANAEKGNLAPELLKVTQIKADYVGLITTADGQTLPEGRIAAPSVDGHESFQNPQSFMTKGGFKGLQQEVLRPGSYVLNTWFAKIEQVPMTEIEIGYVGIVVSSSGESDEDVSGALFTHGNLVKKGNRGIWSEPLFPGKHPLNTKILKVEKVPTTNVVLNWGHESASHKYDEKLSSIAARTKDGFSMSIDVSQIVHIPAKDASKVISRVGSMKNLVENVLEPIIGNYFRNSAQAADALDFIKSRAERQKEASEFISKAIKDYDVEAVDTLIGDLIPPEQLMATLTTRKIADEEKITYKSQMEAQEERKKLLVSTAMAEAQAEVVKEEQRIKVAESQAKQVKEKAIGESDKIRVEAQAKADSIKMMAEAEAEQITKIGAAKAESYRLSADSLGRGNFASLEMIGKLADKNIKITPDIVSGGGSGGGMESLLLASILRNMQQDKKDT
jgi:uncharacterized membrane protein YqiK